MFTDFKKIGDELLDLVDPAASLTLVAGFKAVVSAWFVGYIIYVGYMTIAGRTKTPVPDIFIKVVAFTAIAAFAFNVGGWYNLAINGVNGLSNWASGGGVVNIYSSLDLGLIQIDHLHQIFIKNDATWGYPLIASAGAAVIYIAYYAFAIFVTFLLIANTLTLKLVIFLFPIAVVTLFFPMVKGVFERWVELALANIISILLISIFFTSIWKSVHKKMSSIITGAAGNEIITVAFSLAGLYLLGLFLITMAVSLANSLTRASIERLPGAAGKSAVTAGAASAYVGAKGGQMAGKGLGKAGGAVKSSAAAAKAGASKIHSIMKTNAGKATSARTNAASANASRGGNSKSSAAWAKKGAINKANKAKKEKE